MGVWRVSSCLSEEEPGREWNNQVDKLRESEYLRVVPLSLESRVEWLSRDLDKTLREAKGHYCFRYLSESDVNRNRS